METYNEWLKENESRLEEDYEFDLNEALRLKNVSDYGNEMWKNRQTFEDFCKTQYEAEKEEE